MKRFAALMLAVVLFAAPTLALADVDQRSLDDMFGGDEATIVFDEG